MNIVKIIINTYMKKIIILIVMSLMLSSCGTVGKLMPSLGYSTGNQSTASSDINMFIANLLINPVGMILLVKFLNDKRLKAVISIYFFVYGFIFFCYDTYVMIFSRNIIELDTLYLLSNYVMMYIPFKLYNITLKRIINNFLAKRW